MSFILQLLCSPRKGGVTDTLAGFFAAGAMDAGATVMPVALRDFAIAPCIACGACDRPPNLCALDSGTDDAEKLFALFAAASLLVIAAPIFFYALPAHFKAFIDRSQRFWAAGPSYFTTSKPVIVLLTAGRPRGEKLFDGAILTLSWFLKTHDANIVERCLYRGLDTPADITAEIGKSLFALGRAWGEKNVSDN